MMRYLKKNRIKTGIIICLVLCLFIVAKRAFFSQNTLSFLFKEKIWVHRVNSIEKLNDVCSSFKGVEVDVIYSENNIFDVNHLPAKSINLSLYDYLQSSHETKKLNFWLDCKNLNMSNIDSSLIRLNTIIQSLNLNKDNFIIETYDIETIKKIKENGFNVSYYIPENLAILEAHKIENLKEKIKINNSYISFNYRNYKLANKYFPNRKKITWFTGGYEPLSRFKAWLTIYQILFDSNVLVVLINTGKVGNR